VAYNNIFRHSQSAHLNRIGSWKQRARVPYTTTVTMIRSRLLGGVLDEISRSKARLRVERMEQPEYVPKFLFTMHS